MLTKKQVFEAALKYAQEQNPDESKAAITPNGDFIAGAFWAADLLEAENAELHALLESWVKGISDPHADSKLYYLYRKTLKALEK